MTHATAKINLTDKAFDLGLFGSFMYHIEYKDNSDFVKPIILQISASTEQIARQYASQLGYDIPSQGSINCVGLA